MFSKFIIATDLSPASYAVVNCIEDIKYYGAKQCLLLLCLSWQEAGSTALSYHTDFIESHLHQQKKILEKQGFEVETRIVTGSAKRMINQISLKENYSIVIVGSRGHTLIDEIGEAFLGGVAYEVIHNARKPILLIRNKLENKEDLESVEAVCCDFTQHILFPTDFSENADHAFTYIQKMAEGGAQKITLLHVQDKTRIAPYLTHRLEEFNEIDRDRLEKMKEILQRKSNTEINIELRYGTPVAEILRFAQENNIHLIAMGSQGRGIIQEVFLGSVSHAVSRYSNSSVLLIPPEKAQS